MSAREPLQFLELIQPRCSLRFGVGDCPATGTDKCYNTWTTCPVRNSYDGLGSIAWRFAPDVPHDFDIGDFSDADNIKTNGIPGLVSISTAKSSMNVAGVLDGRSPFGTRSAISATLTDIPWDDYVGDHYKGDRTLPEREYWAVWTARNAFYGGMYLKAYDGFVGDALADMRQKLYALDKVDGPDGSRRVTLSGVDPLRLTDRDKAEFPRTTELSLAVEITAIETTIRLNVKDILDISDVAEFGNATYRLFRIGDEVIQYAAWTEIETGVYDLTGCIRGFDNTTAASARIDTRAQRCGRFVDIEPWLIAKYLFQNSTRVPAAFFDFDQWADEGDGYLTTLRSTITIAEVNAIESLMGELTQQGLFNIWWNEAAQNIPMLAVRPAIGAVTVIDGDSNILADTAVLKRQPDAMMTRCFVYYGPRNPTKSRTEKSNYQRLAGQTEAENESDNASGGKAVREVFARFINTEAHAFQLITRMFLRYREIPRFLSIRVSAKDRSIEVGQVCDVTTRTIVDKDGQVLQSRWQVIAVDEVVAGEVYLLDLQTFDLIGRYGIWMASDTPDYLDATDEQRAAGAWWSDAAGLMSDGSNGYKWN
jgi:hypothetical protein